MAETPKIHRGVQYKRVVYLPGDEEALAKVLDADQVKSLTEDGVISGFPKPPKKSHEKKSEEKGS